MSERQAGPSRAARPRRRSGPRTRSPGGAAGRGPTAGPSRRRGRGRAGPGGGAVAARVSPASWCPSYERAGASSVRGSQGPRAAPARPLPPPPRPPSVRGAHVSARGRPPLSAALCPGPDRPLAGLRGGRSVSCPAGLPGGRTAPGSLSVAATVSASRREPQAPARPPALAQTCPWSDRPQALTRPFYWA